MGPVAPSAPSVLVLGTGQVGTFAAHAVAEVGAGVLAADVDPAPGFFARYAPAVGTQPVSVDMLDEETLRETLSEHAIEVVVIAAGLVGDACGREPEKAWQINVEGARTVTSASMSAGVRRIVFVSTLAVYGCPDVARIKESCVTAPRSEYGRTKLAAEETIERTCGNSIDVRILRPCGVYGPVRIGRGSQSARFMQAVLVGAGRTNNVAIAAAPTDCVQYLYVKDLARAIACSALSGGDCPGKEIFNVAPAASTTVPELLAAVSAVYPGVNATRVQPDGSATDRQMPPLDASLIGRALGFAPEYDLVHGLLDYARVAGFSP